MKAPRNHKLLLTLLIAVFVQFSTFAQQKDVLLMNSQSFEVEAYKDIDGTPYYFEKWQLGKVYSRDAKADAEELYLLNFNGLTKSFEVRKDNRFIALDEKYYTHITIETEEEGEQKLTTFKTDVHPVYKNRFMKVVFEGTDFYVIQDYKVRLVEREKTTYANKEKIQEFSKDDDYYVVRKGKAKSFKLKKKAILGLFKDQESALKNFVKQHKLKVNKESELVELCAYYEQLTNPNSVALNDKKN